MILELSKMKATVSLEMWRNIRPVTQRKVPQNGNFPLHRMKTSKLARSFFILMESKRSDFIPTHAISPSCAANITLLSSKDDAGCM